MPRVPRSRRPTAEELAAADGVRIPGVIEAGLAVLLCGINPGRYSGAVGHHFAYPGNRFWKALHGAGFTDELISPYDDATLPRYGLGLRYLVPRTTRSAADLDDEVLRHGGRRLERMARRFRPRFVAVLGADSYRRAFGRRNARLGLQEERLAASHVWLLPNPSGLNAHYQLPQLIEEFGKLREAALA
jgi:TDG/mug DNA glycosylase family protein